jgi:hypothetical protein
LDFIDFKQAENGAPETKEPECFYVLFEEDLCLLQLMVESDLAAVIINSDFD